MKENNKKLEIIKLAKNYIAQQSEIYGKELLQDYMFEDQNQAEDKSSKTVSRLVYDYPAHGFAICLNEAKDLGLIIGSSEEYPDWDKIWKFIIRLTNLKRKALWHLTESQLKIWTK